MQLRTRVFIGEVVRRWNLEPLYQICFEPKNGTPILLVPEIEKLTICKNAFFIRSSKLLVEDGSS